MQLPLTAAFLNLQAVRDETVDEGQALFQQGDSSDKLYIVVSGAVVVTMRDAFKAADVWASQQELGLDGRGGGGGGALQRARRAFRGAIEPVPHTPPLESEGDDAQAANEARGARLCSVCFLTSPSALSS